MMKTIWKALTAKEKRPPHPLETQQINFAQFQNGEFIWLGHMFILLKQNDQLIAIDPLMGDLSLLKKFPFTNEYDLTTFPQIDLCLITHDHVDHMDFKTLQKLKITQIICPLQVGKHLQKFCTTVTELDWFQSVALNNNRISLIPSKHFGGGKGGKFSSLWGGFIINNVLVSGDTARCPEMMRQIQAFMQRENIQLQICFIECGQYAAEWPEFHLQPEEVLEYFQQVGGRLLVPVHFGMHAFGYHKWNDVLRVRGDHTLISKIGKNYRIDSQAGVDPCWE